MQTQLADWIRDTPQGIEAATQRVVTGGSGERKEGPR